MPTILSIPIHSFLDVITNSSSEVFLISSQKTLESFKQVIQALAEQYNAETHPGGYISEEVNTDLLWREYFDEPYMVDLNVSRKRIHEYETGSEAVYKSPEYKAARDKIEKGGDADWKICTAIVNAAQKALKREVTSNILLDNKADLTRLHSYLEDDQLFSIFDYFESQPISAGTIFLRSKSDNTIPWGFTEYLSEHLSGTILSRSHV